MRTKLVLLFVATTGLAGCELLVRFDPSRLDGGSDAPPSDTGPGPDVTDASMPDADGGPRDVVTTDADAGTSETGPGDVQDVQIPPDVQDVQTPTDVQDVQIPPDVQDVQMPPDVQDVQTPVDVQDVQVPPDVQDVQTPVDVQDVQVPVDVQDVQMPIDVQDVQVPVDVQDDVQDASTDDAAMDDVQDSGTTMLRVLNNCDPSSASTVDLTAVAMPTIDFTMTPAQYTPSCVIIHQGQTVTFNPTATDFSAVPLLEGEYAGPGSVTPIAGSPIVDTTSGTSPVTFMFNQTGSFGFVAGNGLADPPNSMMGAVYVIP